MAEPSLRRFQPTSTNPWDYGKAAHLLNRAGFGGRPEDIEGLVRAGFPAAVDELLEYERVPNDAEEVDFSVIFQLFEEAQRLQQIGADEATRRQFNQRLQRTYIEKLQETREWWVARMLRTRRPLQERVVLFWHGLLVSGFPDARNPLFLYIQNNLFRRMALGNFKQLILEISRDPAMLDYLDNNSNRKGRPNENYARELLELFTMGIGNYTEQDIKEAARAFTGWTHRGTEFFFARAQHDDGPKTFLGRTGNLDGTDIIDIVFEQEATARFLPRRLYEYFVALRPSEGVVDELGALFRRVNFEVKPIVRTLLLSEAFYAPQVVAAQVKGPSQLVVGAARVLGVQPDAMIVRALVLAMDQMGQALMYPPNVGGWPRGEGWITTSTILDRYNFGGALSTGRVPGPAQRLIRGLRPPAVQDLVPSTASTAGQVVDALLRRMLPGATLDQRRLFGLWRAAGGNRASDAVQVAPERIRAVLHLIMSMPEFQMH